MKRILFAVLYFGGVATILGQGETLTLSDYLRQVQTQGPDYLSRQASAKGLERQSQQMGLTYSPVLTAGYNHLDDSESPENLSAMPHTQSDSAGVSISTKLDFGPSITLGYSFVHTNQEFNALYNALGSTAGLIGDYNQTAPSLSLSIPLLRDFAGSQTSAQIHKSQYQYESTSKEEYFQMAEEIYKAKVAYWTLAQARVEVMIRQDTLARDQKINEWTQKRLERQLADQTDALQSEMAVQKSELNLRKAQETECSARFEFNRYRNMGNGEVPENLDPLEDSMLQTKVDLPEDPPKRLDLEAAEKTADQQKAALDDARQDIYPDLTVKASWCGNGYASDWGAANQLSFKNDYPTYNIGAQFSFSLDAFTASRVAEGYQRTYESSCLTLRNKRLEVAQQWTDLKEKIRDVDERLSMATQIEKLQKRNAEEQKVELTQGRTTQYQLLSCENDYSLSRLDRISIVLEKLTLLAEAQWWLAGANPNSQGGAK